MIAQNTEISDQPRSGNDDWTLDSLSQQLTRLTYFRGRVALSAILRGLGIGAGDDVLLQAFTCVAVPEGVMSVGATPIYVDVSLGTPNMDPTDVPSKITPRTKAIIIQHSYGLPADVVTLTRIAREHGIAVIEDCAHTIASKVDGRFVGSFGDAAFYSYEAAKPVFVGIGGSAIVNDDELARRVERDYSTLEQPPILSQLETRAMVFGYRVAYTPATYWTVRSIFRGLSKAGLIRGNYNKVGHSLRPASDFQRKMGRVQSRMLEIAVSDLTIQTDHRIAVAREYRERIGTRNVEHFPIPSGVEPVFGRYPMIARDKTSLVGRAREAKVEIAVFYDTPVQPLEGLALRDVLYEPGSCPRAEQLSAQVVSLPTGLQVTDAQIKRSVDFLNSAA